jgi:hypothetical protein
MSRRISCITHPEVVIDHTVLVPQWPLSTCGRRRMQRLLHQDWLAHVEALYCSTEQKAIDGATILSEALGIPFYQVTALGKTTAPPLATSPRRSLTPRSMPSLSGPTRASVAGSAPSTSRHVSSKLSPAGVHGTGCGPYCGSVPWRGGGSPALPSHRDAYRPDSRATRGIGGQLFPL